MAESKIGVSEAAERVAKAKRLFEFLARSQELKVPRVRDTKSYEHVLWLCDLPVHPGVSFDLSEDAGPGRPVLVLGRVRRKDAPAVPEVVQPWLRLTSLNPAARPTLKRAIAPAVLGTDTSEPVGEVLLAEHPHVQKAFDAWIEDWDEWAARDRIDQQVNENYRNLFNSYELSTSKPDEYELVVGIGYLAWNPPGSLAVRRHLLTTPVRLNLDDTSGDLIAAIDVGAGYQLETDMLDPGQIPPAFSIEIFTRQAAAGSAHPLDVEVVGELARRLVLSLGPESTYDNTLNRPSGSAAPVGTLAPAIILRRRSTRGLVQLLRDIGAQLESAQDVPEGLRPLVDPDFQRQVAPDPAPGGLVTVGEEIFQAMPVNDRQQQVIANVDTHAQTLVQGPPGTGKTHTAAALLTHLLAQGKRVLITAQTDRALKEVRGKLPEAIRPLAVSVVGASRADTADLKTAVEMIASQATEFDRSEAAKEIAKRLATIDSLQRDRSLVYRTLRDSRERETTQLSHLAYTGTLATIARRVQDQAPGFDWLREFVTPGPDDTCPLSKHDAVDWLALLRDEDLNHNAHEAAKALISLAALPSIDEFADMVHRIKSAEAQVAAHVGDQVSAAHRALRSVPDHVRRPVQERMRQLGLWAGDLERRHEAWTQDALSDIRAGRRTAWANRAAVVRDLCWQVAPLVDQLGHLPNVVVKAGDIALHRHQAQDLVPVLNAGHTIKRGADGAPKIGMFAPRAVRAAAPFFASVVVDGLSPTTSEQVGRFLLWLQVEELLTALDRAWPATVAIPHEDTPRERLDWHVVELEQLTILLQLGDAIGYANRELDAAGLPHPDWTTLHDIEAYAAAVDAVVAEETLSAAQQPLDALIVSTQRFLDSTTAAGAIADLGRDLRCRDVAGYRDRLTRLDELHRAKANLERRDAFGARLRRSSPTLEAAVKADPTALVWDERMQLLPAAWEWAATAVWVVSREQVDANALQLQLDAIEDQIRLEIERLAAARAWSHAVAPERLTGTARADLTQYAQLVRRLGRGTGKYAAVQRAEIRDALDRCGSAVPVWIMPIYRIAEQLSVREGMFDVVVVDEASQAGMEAAFLQYLAPKIVVIGDDKQVSPSAVGVNRQELRDLADQYLRDDRYKASWQDPERSLFDEAKMRYGSMITLVEHRRCVPEIIGFSNRIAYEPEGIRLIPVRQYGSDRLEPIIPIHVADGYENGVTSKINRPEIDAIVSQIEKCLADPRYDGLTFGIISLLGTAQARQIEARLLERIPPEEWTARDLRCGDAADFQGSERDVVFLSMVAAPSDRRLAALTRDMFVQRYNVAVSRAKDQLWLFHSLQISDVVNGDDMRFQLLDYCYGVANRRHAPADDTIVTPVPEDVRVDPFDSLFEQRVFNRVLDRGYSVIPQFETDSYRIDMVVVGTRARLAIECDGDHWHGPEQYAIDLARQRDLERAGWVFFRIRESEFYIDKATILDALWQKLEALDIQPHSQAPDGQAAVAPGKEEMEFVTPSELEGEIADVIAQTPPTVEEVGQIGTHPDEPAQLPTEAEITGVIAAHSEPSPADPLPAYRGFWGDLPHPVESSSADVMRGLIEIVAVEGPVTRNRLFFAYVQASEVQRGGKVIINHLAQAIGKAVRSGHIIADGRGAGVAYRLVDQPAVRRRQLGPRLLVDVPSAELAALLEDAANSLGWQDPDAVFREVLGRIGLRRLSSEARRVLMNALRATE